MPSEAKYDITVFVVWIDALFYIKIELILRIVGNCSLSRSI
jgi:hypothetical protein